MLRKHVPETIDEYCVDLRKKLSGVLPEEKIAEAVAETRAHLQDSAVELLGAEGGGEKQALAQFVSVGKLARGLNRAWSPLYLRHSGTKLLQNISACLCLSIAVIVLGVLLVGSKLPASPVGFLEVVLGSGVLPPVVFCLALLACRAQARRFTCGGLGVMGAYFCLVGWLFAWCNYNLPISRFDASARYKDALVLSLFLQEEMELLNQGEKFYSQYSNSPQYASRESAKQKLKELLYRKHTLLFQHASEESLMEIRGAIAEAEREKVMHDIALKKSLQDIPSPLRRGKSYIVPREAGWGGDFIFRRVDIHKLNEQFKATHPLGINNQVRVDAARRTPVETVDSLDEAVKRWHDAPAYHRTTKGAVVEFFTRQAEQARLLMESSLCRFDLRAAASTFLIVIPVGKAILADLSGGWLGGLILREWRRRKGGNGMRLKS